MNNKLKTSEIIPFLKAIESGKVLLSTQTEPQDVYAGNVFYKASNGWTITIFNDCNEFDYIDNIYGDGKGIEYVDNIPKYNPSALIVWRCYGIPGYLKRRCVECGHEYVWSHKKLVWLPHKCKTKNKYSKRFLHVGT